MSTALPLPLPTVAREARTAVLALAFAALAAWIVITWLVGLRQGFLFLVGIGYGAVLAGVSFGFTTGWRVWIRERDPTGLLAQFVAIGLAMAVTIPLLTTHPELSGAIAPVSFSVVIGAFVFGLAMQVADGCGSGTLYKAGHGQRLCADGASGLRRRQLPRHAAPRSLARPRGTAAGRAAGSHRCDRCAWRCKPRS